MSKRYKTKKNMNMQKKDMNVFGVVAEYNPFHNGHKFQLERAFELGATHVIAVMSPNFVQRGEPSITDKFFRAKAAVKSGVDLVLELPTPVALSCAERFAFGAVYLLDRLGVINHLIFGTEVDNIDILESIVDVTMRDDDDKDNSSNNNSNNSVNTKNNSNIKKVFFNEIFNEILKKKLKEGISFPKARQLALEQTLSQHLSNQKNAQDIKHISSMMSQPNNILAIEYLKSLRKLGSKIKPLAVKRVGSAHDQKHDHKKIADGRIISAFHLREIVKQKHGIENWRDFVPSEAYDVYQEAFDKNMLPALEIHGERAVISKLRATTVEEIRAIPDVSEGLENRILKSVESSRSLDEIYKKIKTKRYTMSRIRRIVYNLFLDLDYKKEQMMPDYVRVLACNQKGIELISEIKKRNSVQINQNLNKLSKLSKNSKLSVDIELKSGNMYGVFCPEIPECNLDLKNKINIY